MKKKSSEEEEVGRLVERAERLVEELEKVFDGLYRLGALNEFMLGEADACFFMLRSLIRRVKEEGRAGGVP